MAEERKAILLRIAPELWEQINRLAQQELRSTNAQIEFMLRQQLKARGMIRDDAGAPAAPPPSGEKSDPH